MVLSRSQIELHLIQIMRTLTYTTLFLISSMLCAQSAVELPLEDQFDEITQNWVTKSEYLKTYQGLNEYCRNPDFRKSVDEILKEIHAYDSLILSKLNDPTSYLSWNKKASKKTFSDIEDLEHEFSLAHFIDKMRSSCEFRNEIEANADELKSGVGYESYDSKVYLLETELTKYLHKIDKLIVRVDDNLHVLHLD